MGKLLPYALFLTLLFASALAAPQEETPKVTEPEKKVAATEREVVTIDDTWVNYFSNNSYAIGSALLGALFIAAGVGVFSYYYVYNYNVNADPAAYPNNPNANYLGQPNYYNYGTYGAAGRALDTGAKWNFNWAKVLDYIDIAQKTYEGFDWQNLNCQKRVLCEIAQERSPAGETGRKMTNNYLLTLADSLEGIPMPRVVQSYLAEYKEAVMQGKSKNNCGEIYSTCKFSISQLVQNMKSRKQ